MAKFKYPQGYLAKRGYPFTRGKDMAECSKKTILCLGVCALWTFNAFATNAWFSGGTHDGYFESRIAGIPDYPRVHNANGATNITLTSAFLNGMLVSDGGAPARVTVFWALEDGGCDVNAWQTAEGADSHVFGDFDEVAPFDPLTRQISVQEGRCYYYRFYAENTADEASWALESEMFLVPSGPVVSTGFGAGVGFISATLNGELTAGIEAEMELHWAETPAGVEPGEWTTIDLGQRTVAGTLEAPNPFRVALEGLSPETGYAYRLRAENIYGVAFSPWVWFATHPADFITTADLGWTGGGFYDGYDFWALDNMLLPGPAPGTVIIFR